MRSLFGVTRLRWIESCTEESHATSVQTCVTNNNSTVLNVCRVAKQQNAILRPFFQVHLSDPVLSQRRDLLEQPLDFYEPDVLPATQPMVSKHYRITQWFGRLLFYRRGISTPCLTNSVKAELHNYNRNGILWFKSGLNLNLHVIVTFV